MKFLIILFKIHLRFIYYFLKLLPTTKKIVFISRQSDEPSIDFLMIENVLNEKKYEMVIICKKMKNNLKGYINYYFNLYKQMYHLATSKVCIIDSYCIPVSILNHKKELTIIQIWHAMGAIKKFGYQTLNKKDGRNDKISKLMCMHQNYDYILSGSKSMIKPFSEAFNTDKKKFVVCGLPRIDYIIKTREELSKKIKKDYPVLLKKKNILYAPTFRNNNNIKLKELINCIDFNKYNLIVKLHFNTRDIIDDPRVLLCHEYSSLDLLSITDYIISDYSAISIEAVCLNIPIFLYVYDYENYVENNGLNIDLYNEFKPYVYEKPDELFYELSKDKYDMTVLNKFKNKYVAPNIGNYTGIIVDLIERNM